MSLSHPDGLAQMMSFKSEITGHFTSAPFMYHRARRQAKVHRVLNSYDVFGGPHTFNVVWATGKFYKDEPQDRAGLPGGAEDRHGGHQDDPAAAAALWVKADNSKLPVAEAEAHHHASRKTPSP